MRRSDLSLGFWLWSCALCLMLMEGRAEAAVGPSTVLESGSHCVAYRARKTILMIKSDEVVGRNCDISVQVLPELGGTFHIEVTVPIRGFKSGDSTRDEDVAKTLKADERSDLVFRSQALTVEQWRQMFAKSEFKVEGDLSIGAKSYPLTLTSHYKEGGDAPEVEGVAHVNFRDFEISPPALIGGLVVKSDPDFELHFHLLGSRILGADSIRLNPPVTSEKEGTP